jgi:hypothetical protein
MEWLLGELQRVPGGPVLALREVTLRAQPFTARLLPASAGAPARLREGGTYLATGGRARWAWHWCAALRRRRA